MTEKELKYMESTLHYGTIQRDNETWLKAFRLYNEGREKQFTKSMNCSPCYKIVFDYHKKLA